MSSQTITTTRNANPASQFYSSLPNSFRNKSVLLLVLTALLGMLFVASLRFGYTALADVPLWSLLQKLWSDDAVSDPQMQNLLSVIRDLRLPRAVIAAAVGACLGMAGVLTQGITRNGLASPGVLGITAGAGFCIVVAYTLFGISAPEQMMWFSFLGSLGSAALIFLLAGFSATVSGPLGLTLAGIALSALLSSWSSGLLVLNEAAQSELMLWLTGNIEGRKLAHALPLLPFALAGALVALGLSRSLNTLALGEETAQGLGINLGRLRLGALIAVVLLTGSAVAMAGPVGFIGLIVPHVCRALLGIDYRWLLPAAALTGSSLLTAADISARFLFFPSEVPVGLAMAVLGAPFFIYLACRRRGTVL
ncbi:FecCD family ABC transporter permease [Plesiomonas shigelloides]|uniref:FecCD family ABC transporter permease n=1 Tax=Plesiomonas shigelloides TaxID=703 RepID=UPI002247B224|nr:iron ABC transporter permease [Plesiomonas shigelloides]MCX2496484.1 iron ABC transporter permease [Plesiomonas shigelloides]